MYNIRLDQLNRCVRVMHRGVELAPINLLSPYMCHVLQDACESLGYSRDGDEYLDAQEIIDAMLDLSTNATVQGIIWNTLSGIDEDTVYKYWAMFWTSFATALIDKADIEYVVMDTTIALAYAEAIKTITEAYHAECEHKGT